MSVQLRSLQETEGRYARGEDRIELVACSNVWDAEGRGRGMGDVEDIMSRH